MIAQFYSLRVKETGLIERGKTKARNNYIVLLLWVLNKTFVLLASKPSQYVIRYKCYASVKARNLQLQNRNLI